MSKEYMVYNNQLWEPYETFKYSGHLEELTLEPDTYLFVANGARGGNAPKNGNQFISWGGTTYGILDLDHTQTFYVNVGGNGGDSTTGDTRAAGGYNGGGDGGLSGNRINPNGCGGGGATDVRLSNVENGVVEEPIFAPHGFDQVEYLSLTGPDCAAGGYGGNVFNTGYYITSTARIELMIETMRNTTGGETFARYAFGASSGPNYFPSAMNTCLSDDSYGPRTFINDTQRSPGQDMMEVEWGTPEWEYIANNRYWYDHGKTLFVLDGSTLTYATEDGEIGYTLDCRADRIDCEYPMYIFGVNCSGNIADGSGYYANTPHVAQMRFYYMKVWEGSELIHWYVPIARSNDPGGIIPYETGQSDYTNEQKAMLRNRCLYDLVEQKMFLGIIPENTPYPERKRPYFVSGPRRDPIDQDYYATREVQVIRGASSRIFVAAGGGGTSIQYNTGDQVQDFNSFGGASVSGILNGPGMTSLNNAGLRATQTSGYSFGVGENAEDRISASGAVSWGMEGQGGGGGGWYGGYSITGADSTLITYSSYGGTGGSSYVLTNSSYKPAGYLDGYTDIMESLYFRNTLMIAHQAFDGPSFTVYKLAEQKPVTHDKIIVPFTGSWQKTNFLPASYRIKCYGGDGGTRYDNSKASKGGYAEGVLNLPEARDLFLHVGASRYIIGTDSTNDILDQIYGGTQFKVFQASSITTSSSAGIQDHACGGGGSVDVRLEQTGNVPTIITVPDGYDEVEYVQSNGTQYIKTVTSTSATDFECVCEITNTGGSQCIFGVGINSSDGTAYKRALAVYAIYDPADPQSAFLCKDQVFMNGSTMPFNQKIKIVINDNILKWYDMSDQLLGSITATARSIYSSNEILLFDASNGKSGSSLAPLGHYSTAKIYSFKRIGRSTGNISNYLVPCVSQSDPTQIGFYDLAGKAYYFKGGGDTFTCGQVVPKTEYMGTVSNTTNSRLSRFIIAGGGGGQGSPIGLGGDGGGEEGEECKGSATYGSNKGPGKRTSGSSFEVTTSGDAGGSAYVDGIKTYGGGGGYGWYSGYGTQNTVTVKMSSDDVNKGGSGGSSYVFSEETDQYKRSGYRVDTSYWLTDTKNILGGNPVRGMTRIEIEIESTSERVLSVMAGDSDGYKAYDTEMNSWISLIDIDELTPEIFAEYGITLESIENDEGLSFPYKLYVYDPLDTGVNKIYSYVVPAQQRITFSNNCDVRRVRKYIIDGEFDEHVTAALNYELIDEAINTELLMDMSDVIEKDSFVCMVQYRVTKNSSTEFKHTDLTKSGNEILLYSTLTDKRIPAENKEYPYPYPYMADKRTTISSITNACACIHNRKVYVASLLNNTSIRVNSYDMTTNECDMIIDDVAKAPLSGSGATGGSLLADENGLYLGNSFMTNGTSDVIILYIPYDGSTTVRYRARDAVPDNEKGCRTAYGQMYWYSPTKILSCAMNGFILFDTTTGTFTQVLDDVNTDKFYANSFAMGDYTVLKCLYDEGGTTTVHVFDKETLTAVTGYNVTFPSGTRCASFSDGKFYIAQPGHLYIFEDNDTCKPTLVSDIPIPDNTLQPKTVDQTDGFIYITFSVSNVMYVYSTKEQTWTDITIPFTNPDYNTTGWHRPATFKGYIYLGDMELFVTNASMYNKYKIGERNSYVHAITNLEFASHMTYDNRFITVDEVGAHIHAGYLDKALSTIASGSKIKQSQDYLATDYNRLLGHSFRKGE